MIGRTEDVHAPSVTQLWVRYEDSQARDGPEMPKEVWSRLSKVVWSTVSKAALRSRESKSISMDASVKVCDYR